MQSCVAFAVSVVDIELLGQKHAQHFQVSLKHGDHHHAVSSGVCVLVVNLESLHDFPDLHTLAGDDGLFQATVGLLVDLAHDFSELGILLAHVADRVSGVGGGLLLLCVLREPRQREVDADALFDIDDVAGDLELFVEAEVLVGRELAERDLEALELGVRFVECFETDLVFSLDERAEGLLLLFLFEQPASFLEPLLLIPDH